METVDVDPGDGPSSGGEDSFQGLDFSFLKVGLVVYAEGDLRLIRVLLPDMDQGTGRETGLGGSSFYDAGHAACLRKRFILSGLPAANPVRKQRYFSPWSPEIQ